MSSRVPMVAGNWKMHKDVDATAAFLEGLLATDPPTTVDVVVCPPYTSIPHAAMVVTGSAIQLGAQNVHWADHGAFTGEISAAMLLGLGVQWAIVGHSERRTLFGETDQTALDRASHAQASGLGAIFCIGETIEEREAGTTYDVLERQTSGFASLDPARLVVAYEPVWAIGTGLTATADQAQEAHAFVRQRLVSAFGDDDAGAIRTLYGGSLKPSNAHELLARPDVDGGLIGGASLDVDSFSAIIRAAAECAAGD